jgi:chromosome partitioning protein
MRIIAIVSQKGGEGKTTTTMNLSAALSRLGKRVLMVDLDPQAHLTICSGTDLESQKFSIYDALSAKIPIKRIIINLSLNLYLVPSHSILSKLEIKKLKGSEFLLNEAFKNFGRVYNYILIDCPPSWGIMTVNALSFAREIFIVFQTEYLSLKTFPSLLTLINEIKINFNPGVKITGVIVSLYDSRRKLDKRVIEELQHHIKYKFRMFKTVIRKNVALAESPALGKHIFKYAPRSYGAQDYLSLAREVIKMEKEKGF